jgi:hypothetical protein
MEGLLEYLARSRSMGTSCFAKEIIDGLEDA